MATRKGLILATMAGAAAGLYLLAKKHESDPDHVSVENNDQQPSQSSARRFVGVGAADLDELYRRTNAFMSKNVKPVKKTVYAYFPSIDKNDTIRQYLEDGEEYDTGEPYWDTFERAYVKTRQFMEFNQKTYCSQEINFTDKQQNEYWFLCNNLMLNYTIFDKRGGTTAEDERLAPYSEIWQVPREIMRSVEWIVNDAILVKFNGIPQFVVDPEGYSYARSIGFVETFFSYMI